jgi:hypothetical protein
LPKRPHKRLPFLGVSLVLLALQPLLPAAAVTLPYELTLTLPGGAAMSNSTVTVSLEPFNAPNAYASAVLAQGVTNADGLFGFELSSDAVADAAFQAASDTLGLLPPDVPFPGGGEQTADALMLEFLGADFGPETKDGLTQNLASINAHVMAVNPEHTWLASWDVILPLTDGYSETIEANVDLSLLPEAAAMSDEGLTGAYQRVTTCLPATEPEGFDHMLLNIEDDYEGLVGAAQETADPQDYCATSVEQGPLPATSSTGVPSFDPCDPDNGPFWNCLAGSKRRWTATLEWHVGQGMRSTYNYGGVESHDTSAETLVDFGGGYQVGGRVSEQKARGNWADVTKERAYHRYRVAQYRYNNYRTCTYDPISTNIYCEDKWKIFHWTGGFFKHSNVEAGLPPVDKAHAIRLAVGGTWGTSNMRQKTFGLGVYLLGVGLETQSGFSTTTSVKWTGIPGCGSHRWLWGYNGKDPTNASLIYAACSS